MRNSDLKHRSHPTGFTLIELLLVMVILAILAAVIVPKFTGQSEHAKITAAKADITVLKGALQRFEIENSSYPTTEQGLEALVVKPSGDFPNWKRPYIDKLNNDPWGHAYIYRCPGTNGQDFDLLSGGPDGHEGGGDDVD
jgi:general secretion pathway protein G